MAVASLWTLEAVLTGLASGERHVGPLVQTSAVGRSETLNLASGANTITVPTGATAVLIVPPTANAATLTLKGVTGDTGVALSPTKPFLLSLAAVSTFVLTAGAGVTGVEFVWM